MKGDQFIAEVRNLAELANNEEAVKATSATLETLRERLAGNEPSDLAAQLPLEVASYVEGSGSGESFSVEEFYDRVAQREGVGRDEAVRHARAVATVVQTAVTGGKSTTYAPSSGTSKRSSSARRGPPLRVCYSGVCLFVPAGSARNTTTIRARRSGAPKVRTLAQQRWWLKKG
jgi:uncharacterized protein (DUF2267 family)